MDRRQALRTTLTMAAAAVTLRGDLLARQAASPRPAVPGSTLYVNPGGADANAGAKDAPLRSLGLAQADVYATNAFPFMKPDGMSSAIPPGDVVQALQLFAGTELAMVQATVVLAAGAVAYAALERVGIASIRLPHPAARIGSAEAHDTETKGRLNAGRLLFETARTYRSLNGTDTARITDVALPRIVPGLNVHVLTHSSAFASSPMGPLPTT